MLVDGRICWIFRDRPCLNRTFTSSWDGATTDTKATSRRAIRIVRPLFPNSFVQNFVVHILFYTWRHNSLSLSLYLCCVDYSRQGLPYPPSGYAEMDNAVPPDRYGNYSSPLFPYVCVSLF